MLIMKKGKGEQIKGWNCLIRKEAKLLEKKENYKYRAILETDSVKGNGNERKSLKRVIQKNLSKPKSAAEIERINT